MISRLPADFFDSATTTSSSKSSETKSSSTQKQHSSGPTQTNNGADPNLPAGKGNSSKVLQVYAMQNLQYFFMTYQLDLHINPFQSETVRKVTVSQRSKIVSQILFSPSSSKVFHYIVC